jgi:hypothetical protein
VNVVDEHEEHKEGESEGARIEMRQRRIYFDSRLNQPVAGVESKKFRIGFNDYGHDEIEGGEVGTEFCRKGFERRAEVLLASVSGVFQTELSQAVGIQFFQDTFKAVGEEAIVPETNTFIGGELNLSYQLVDGSALMTCRVFLPTVLDLGLKPLVWRYSPLSLTGWYLVSGNKSKSRIKLRLMKK